MNTAVIVPGFAESRVHFQRLITALENAGIHCVVIQPWERGKLQTYRDRAVFIGHSMGAYYVARNDLTPALLVGVVQPYQPRENFMTSIRTITKRAWMQGDILYHAKLRLGNIWNILRYWLRYTQYGLTVVRHRAITARSDDVIIIKNEADPLSITKEVDFHEHGHHDDILYRPNAYIRYIQQLLEPSVKTNNIFYRGAHDMIEATGV